MNIQPLTDAQRERAAEIFAIAFEQPLDRTAPRQTGKDHPWGAFAEDGELMSILTVNDYTVGFDGGTYAMGGIGGVATLPQYRRTGGIREIFRQMLPWMHRSGYALSYLYPFSTAFYRQFGYECCVNRWAFTIDLNQLPPCRVPGFVRMADAHRDLSADIRAVDAVWEAEYNLSVQHSAEDYRWAAQADPAAKQEFICVWYRPEGTPGAYAVYHKEDQPDGRNLVCSRFCFRDRDGFDGILGLLRSLRADHKYLKLELPMDGALPYLFPEWSLGAASWRVSCCGMVRVTDVVQVLYGAALRGSGSVKLAIRDPWIPENDGCFALTWQADGSRTAEKCCEAPDVTLDIGTFSALITGVCDFAEARQYHRGLTVHTDADCSGLFYRKKLLIRDYF